MTDQEKAAGEAIKKQYETAMQAVRADYYAKIAPFEKEKDEKEDALRAQLRLDLEALWPDLVEYHNRVLGPKK